MKKWVFSQYELKVYDKGRHCDLNKNIIIIEKKFKESQPLKKMGIEYLSDLLDKWKLSLLMNSLIETIDHLVLIDTLVPPNTLTEKENNLFNLGINPMIWQSCSGMKKSRFKKKFNLMLEKHKLDSFKKQLINQIEEKCKGLLSGN